VEEYIWKTLELFFQNPVNVLGRQLIIRDAQKPETKVFFTPKCFVCGYISNRKDLKSTEFIS